MFTATDAHTVSVACCISFWFYWTVLLMYCLCLLKQIMPSLPCPSLFFSRQRIQCIVWYVFLVISEFHCQKGTNNFMSTDLFFTKIQVFCVIGHRVLNIFKDIGAFTFRVSQRSCVLGLIDPRWRRRSPSKCQNCWPATVSYHRRLECGTALL